MVALASAIGKHGTGGVVVACCMTGHRFV